MNALIVRIVATVALLLWPILFLPTLAVLWPPRLSIWQEFTDGAAYLTKRIKLGGL